MIALAAGEIKDPRRNIPRVARMVFYRIVGFYGFGVLGVGIICSSKDSRLLGAIDNGSSGFAASPWVIGITNLGISGLAGLVNVLILISGWSCGNAYLYSASRTLYSLALDGQAPRFFLKCTKAGTPIYAVLTVALIGCITFLTSSNSAATVFGWFVDLATCGFVLSYTAFQVTWIGWDRALKAQGVSRDRLHWNGPLMPHAAYVGVVTGLVVLFFIGFDVFVPFNIQGFITSYFGIAFAGAVFLLWKILKRSKFVKPSEADLWSGKAEVDAECSIWKVEGEERAATALGRFWDKIW
ncbi:Proline-specific permease [Fulvia fulva]|uniref:Proline-specific permease n=1 Tax=Passalora fulva TaxID=5499 RepID=A0A9Q8LCA9_PASFU|nr:Proline-specific permease [Fulvia fulva]KAK4629082.1 Proline-specific permease [Fulvia fulva]KAK4630530.1 Proline-specific permease [Fulvia fulva]UJO14886.1 Proline-specific permease [Fulvia fulva]WPV12295.1 Proline-specific permease [Fulvia fulva]WPV27914.1 Proline-specific permease [Fulvia fulva]